MTQKEENYEEALLRIKQWCDAYPVGVFPELTKEQIARAADLCQANGISFGGLHAQWARHITAGIRDIIELELKGERLR